MAKDPSYVGALKEAGLASVFLQFDGMEDTVYRKLRGRDLFREKRLAIEHCAGHGIGVVLVPTLVPGVNTDQIGAIIEFALQELPAVRGVHFQPVSYFGRYPSPPGDEDRITIPEIITEIETQTGGRIRAGALQTSGMRKRSLLVPWQLRAPDRWRTQSLDALPVRRLRLQTPSGGRRRGQSTPVRHSILVAAKGRTIVFREGQRSKPWGLGRLFDPRPNAFALRFGDGLPGRMDPGSGASQGLLHSRRAPGWTVDPVLRL